MSGLDSPSTTMRSSTSLDSDSTPRNSGSWIRRSAHAMHDLFPFPFSSSALRSLPQNPEGIRDRATRSDNIPDVVRDEDGQITNYQTITGGRTVQVRVPKKVQTPVKVEAKVWFANERTWVSYMNVGILLATLSAALYNSAEDPIAKNFSYVYAVISLATLIYGYVIYQQRVTLIRRRHSGHFDVIVGPVCIGLSLFVAVLVNFILRIREFRRMVLNSTSSTEYMYR